MQVQFNPRGFTVQMGRFTFKAGKFRSRSSELDWAKSSLSYANGSCVEVAGLSDNLIRVRDSKTPKGAILRFTPDEWDAFLGGVRKGEFDRTQPPGADL
jgi:Domain of unknown function (DUF397)